MTPIYMWTKVKKCEGEEKNTLFVDLKLFSGINERLPSNSKC